MGKLKNNRQGSLSLEAAIIMPVILLMAGLTVWLLQVIGAEIKLKGALDRAAAELSLLSPLCDQLNQSAADLKEQLPDLLPGDTSSLSDDWLAMLQEIWPEDQLQGFLADAVLDLTSSALFGNLLQSRLDYWLSEAWSGQSGWMNRLGQRQLFLDWRLEKQQLWLCLTYELLTPAGKCCRRTDVVVPLWIGSGGAQASADDQIWMMDNFTRGKSLRQLFGGNLPDDFPVIARFCDGEAAAIKSMDLTAPSYRQPNAVRMAVGAQVSKLAAFQGASRKRGEQNISVAGTSISSRRLLLIIPGNSRQPWLPDLFAELQQMAQNCGVLLEIREHGCSSRYLAAED